MLKLCKVSYRDLSKVEGMLTEFNINVYDKPSITYYALKLDDIFVSALGVEQMTSSKIKLRALYTPDKYRKKGYNGALLDCVINLYDDKIMITEANEYSLNLFLKRGFCIKSQRKYKYWTKYRMERKHEGVNE